MTTASSPLPELPAIGFLAEVPADHRAFLTAFGKFLRPHNGEVFITEGHPQDTLSLVLEGTLHVVSNAGGRPMLLAALGEGDALGEVNLFDPAMASASVIARSECLIWSLTRSELDGLVDADPDAGLSVMRGLLRQLSRRVRHMNDKVADTVQIATIYEGLSTLKP